MAEVDRQQFIRGDARYGGGLNAAVTTGPGEKFARARVVDQLKLASLVMMRELRRFGEPYKRLAEVAELTHRIGSAVVV